MKVVKQTWTASQINNFSVSSSGSVKAAYIDVVTVDSNDETGYETIRKYPLSMSVVNGSGAAIEIAILGNQTEESDFLVNPDDYFFLLPSGASIGSSSRIARIYKVAIRKESGNVSNSVRVDFLNHVGTLKI